MPFADINGTTLYYEEHGEGDETLFFGHGVLLNHHLFDEQVAFLKDQYRCIVWDFRGHGESEVATDGYDLNNQALDVVKLADHLGIDKFHYAGLSMGGFIGIRLGIHHQERLRTLILIDTTSQPKSTLDKLKFAITDMVVKQSGLKPWAKFVIESYFGKTFCNDENSRDKYQQWTHYIGEIDVDGATRANKVVTNREDVTDQLYKIEVPTLIIVGDEDVLTPIGHARNMADHIPHSKVAVIPYAGHCSTVEQPEAVNKALQDFLSSPLSVSDSKPTIEDAGPGHELKGHTKIRARE